MKRVKTDSEVTLKNGTVFKPVATLVDAAAGRVQIVLEEGCYVLCVKREDGYVFTPYIFREAFEVLRTLPTPHRDQSRKLAAKG